VGLRKGWLKRRKRLGLKERIFSKESNFYKMLSDQTSKALEGMEALGDFVRNPNQENANRVRGIEGINRSSK
jgi:hypothetical protein